MYHRDGRPMPQMEEGAAFFQPIAATDDEPRVLGLQPGLLTHGFSGPEPPIQMPESSIPEPTTISEVTIEGTPMGSERYYETPLWRWMAIVGMGLGAYHGYKRNHSVGWAIGWGLFGGFLPIIAIPVALAQGIGKPKGR